MTPQQFFDNLLAAAKSDVLVAAIPPAITFLTNVRSNPDPLNVVAQASVLNVSLLAALPNLERTAIQQMSGSLSTALQSVLADAQAKLAALAAPAQAPAIAAAAKAFGT